MNSLVSGVLLSLITAFSFGSYTSFNKVTSVVESKINPIVFNLYFMIGALLVSIAATVAAIALEYTVAFSYLGLVSGLLLTVSGFCSFVSVPRIGVAYTWAIAATTGCITAFVEGLILGTEIVHWWATIVALITLMSSAAVIVLIKDISSWLFTSAETDFKEATAKMAAMGEISLTTIAESTPLNGNERGTMAVSQSQSSMMRLNRNNIDNNNRISRSSLLIGVLFSIFAGLCLASIPLPSLFVEPNASGLCYFFSLGVGCLLVLPFTLIGLIIDGIMKSKKQNDLKFEGLGHGFSSESSSHYNENDSNCIVKFFNDCGIGIKYLLCENSESLWKARSCLIPGVLSGIVWNGGNVAGIIALNYINYIFLNALVAISTPVAALYGVFLWKELTKTHEIVILFFATFTLIGANVLLAYGLYGSFV